MTDVG